MLSYFGNLVVFCLILKFLKFIILSMVIKEKFLKMKWEKLNFCLFTWLKVCIMFIKIDELLKFLLNSTLVLPFKAIHTLCTIGSDYKIKNYFPLDLGKF